MYTFLSLLTYFVVIKHIVMSIVDQKNSFVSLIYHSFFHMHYDSWQNGTHLTQLQNFKFVISIYKYTLCILSYEYLCLKHLNYWYV